MTIFIYLSFQLVVKMPKMVALRQTVTLTMMTTAQTMTAIIATPTSTNEDMGQGSDL